MRFNHVFSYLVAHPTARKWVITPAIYMGLVGLIHWKNWGELTHLRAVGWATKYGFCRCLPRSPAAFPPGATACSCSTAWRGRGCVWTWRRWPRPREAAGRCCAAPCGTWRLEHGDHCSKMAPFLPVISTNKTPFIECKWPFCHLLVITGYFYGIIQIL